MSTTLMTPEEVAESLHNRVSAFVIRRLVRKGEVACIKAGRGKVLFTDEQVKALLAHLTAPVRVRTTEPAQPEPNLGFRATGRSAASHR